MNPPELVAHRGYTLLYPENTLSAVRGAIEAGGRYVEVDIQLSRDEVPVLFHDHTLKRLCGVDGAVHESALDELRQLHPSDFDRFGYKFAAEPFPTLAELVELIARHPSIIFFIEIKRIALSRFGVAKTVARILHELKPVRRQCVPISYSLTALRAAQAQGWPIVGAVIDRWRDRRRPGLRELAPRYLFCDVDGLPRFGKLKFEGAQLAIFEVQSAATARRLSARGAELIETFHFGELKHELEHKTATP